MLHLLPLLLLSACASGPSDTSSSSSGTGAGTVAGSFDGRPFDVVGAAYAIGQADDPAQTMVVYVFAGAVACADLASPGWDARITDQTQALELKVIGTSTGAYPVATGPTPGSGESSDNYTLSSTSGTPAETSASGGQVVIDGLDGSTTGSFDLQFPSGDALSGSFDATSCPQGTEP